MQNEVFIALEALGDSTEDIASSLYKLGISGCLHEGTNCPIYNYLLEKFGSCEGVHTHGCFINNIEYEIPAAIEDFIEDFDKKLYPELIKKEIDEETLI